MKIMVENVAIHGQKVFIEGYMWQISHTDFVSILNW